MQFLKFFYSFAIRDQGDWSISNRYLFKYTEASPGKVLENESIFQKYQRFSCQKSIFLSKILKIEHILQEFLSCIENLFKNLNFSGGTL